MKQAQLHLLSIINVQSIIASFDSDLNIIYG